MRVRLSLMHLMARVSGQRGQSLTELALVLPIVALLLMGIVDVGFVLYANVQVAAAAGEGANYGSRWPADATNDCDENDLRRLEVVNKAVMQAMGRLNVDDTNSFVKLPYNATTFEFSPSFDLGDIHDTDYVRVIYNVNPCTRDTRVPLSAATAFEEMTVQVKYRQRLFFGIWGTQYMDVVRRVTAKIQ